MTGLRKTIYLSSPEQLVALEDILAKQSLSFSQWITQRMKAEVEAYEAKNGNSSNSGNYGKCEFPRIKRLGLDCSWQVCPLLKAKMSGCGEVAQKREFEAREKCLFRFRGDQLK